MLTNLITLSAAALAVACSGNLQASEIREFDIRTIESLGRKLYQQTQQGAKSLGDLEKRAERSAVLALPRLDERHHRFVVLNDPDGSGFLVYALATSDSPNDIVVGIHFRVSVSGDGQKVERVDSLSRNPLVIKKGSTSPAGYKHAGFYVGQLVSNKPVETFVYLTLLHREPCLVITPDGAIWAIEAGKISKSKPSK